MQRGSLEAMVDANLTIERARIRTQIRQSHLKLQGRTDPDTDDLLGELERLEKYIDKKVSGIIKSHPAYPWFSRVKGIGKENIAKVVAPLRIQPDPDDPEKPYAHYISGFWAYCGYAVVDGHGVKASKGEKTTYNAHLRTMCWRLGGSLMKAKGKFYDYYLAEKDKYVQKYENQGWKVVPAAQLPKDGEGKKREQEGWITEGHIHNMALRKMVKLFLSCLFLTWSEAEGLPRTQPYAIEKLGHNHVINPWDMIDR